MAIENHIIILYAESTIGDELMGLLKKEIWELFLFEGKEYFRHCQDLLQNSQSNIKKKKNSLSYLYSLLSHGTHLWHWVPHQLCA